MRPFLQEIAVTVQNIWLLMGVCRHIPGFRIIIFEREKEHNMSQEDDSPASDGKSEKTAGLAKVLIVIVIVLCSLAGIWAVFYHFFLDVKLTDQARCDEIYKVAMKRMHDAEKVPPQENGYNVLAKVTERNASSQVMAPYKALSQYCYGKVAEIEAGLLKDKKRTEQDIRSFSVKVPDIEKSTSMKYYIFPFNGDYGLDAQLPNFLVMRSTAQSLAALGVYEEMHKKPEEAAGHYLLAIRYGARIGSQGYLLPQMISIALETIGCAPLHCLIAKGNMKSGDYRKIIAELDALPTDRSDFLNSMDEEYARTINSFEDMMSGRKGGIQTYSVTIPPQKIKPIIEREKRFYMNMFIRYRPCFDKICMPEELGLNFEDDIKALNKKMSVLCSTILSNFPRAIAQKKLIMTKLSAVKLMAAIQAYRADKGKYPASLEELCPGYLKSLPEDYMSKDMKFTYALKGKTFSLTSQSELYRYLSLKNPFSFYPPDSSVY